MPVFAAMKRDRVLGNRQRHARAAHLARVHVAVDPRRGASPVRFAPDLEQPELAPLEALADALHPDKLGMGARPVVHHLRQLLIAKISAVEGAHAEFRTKYVMFF